MYCEACPQTGAVRRSSERVQIPAAYTTGGEPSGWANHSTLHVAFPSSVGYRGGLKRSMHTALITSPNGHYYQWPCALGVSAPILLMRQPLNAGLLWSRPMFFPFPYGSGPPMSTCSYIVLHHYEAAHLWRP